MGIVGSLVKQMANSRGYRKVVVSRAAIKLASNIIAKLSSSPVQFSLVELRFSLTPGNYSPTPAGKVEIRPLLDHLGN